MKGDKADEMELVEIAAGESIMKVQRECATWLGVIDLYQVAPLKVTIEKVVFVRNATFEKGRKEDKQALVFRGAKKMLPLNATNAKFLWHNVGKTPAEVSGKEVTLAIEKLDRPFNGSTHGIRVRKSGN